MFVYNKYITTIIISDQFTRHYKIDSLLGDKENVTDSMFQLSLIAVKIASVTITIS